MAAARSHPGTGNIFQRVLTRVGVGNATGAPHLEAATRQQPCHRRGRKQVDVLHVVHRAPLAQRPREPGADIVIDGQQDPAGPEDAKHVLHEGQRIKQVVQDLKEAHAIEAFRLEPIGAEDVVDDRAADVGVGVLDGLTSRFHADDLRKPGRPRRLEEETTGAADLQETLPGRDQRQRPLQLPHVVLQHVVELRFDDVARGAVKLQDFIARINGVRIDQPASSALYDAEVDPAGGPPGGEVHAGRRQALGIPDAEGRVRSAKQAGEILARGKHRRDSPWCQWRAERRTRHGADGVGLDKAQIQAVHTEDFLRIGYVKDKLVLRERSHARHGKGPRFIRAPDPRLSAFGGAARRPRPAIRGPRAVTACDRRHRCRWRT